MPTQNTIIFDFDGTLIDSAPGILATYAAVLEEAGIIPAVPLDERLIGPPLLPTMEKLVRATDVDLLELLVEKFKQRYIDIGIANTPAYVDADTTLSQLRAQGKTLYLATNKRAAPTLSLIEKFGWQQHFQCVYCIDSQHPAFIDKTAMLRRLLTENKLSAEECVYVGDTRGDYFAANACGIVFIAALWGYEDWRASNDTEHMLAHAQSTISQLLNAKV